MSTDFNSSGVNVPKNSARVGCQGAGHNVVRRRGVEHRKEFTLADKNIGLVKINLWGGAGQLFVQGIRFFFSHIRHVDSIAPTGRSGKRLPLTRQG